MMAAPVLVPMAAVFALAPRAFPAGRTLLPAVDLHPWARRPRPRARRLRPVGAALPEGRGSQRLLRAVPRPRARGPRSALGRSARRVRTALAQARRARRSPSSAASRLFWPRPASWVCRSSSRRSSGPWPRPSTRARRAFRASRRSGSSRSWRCRAGASSTCERPTRRPARGSCARRSSPTSTGASGGTRRARPGPSGPGRRRVLRPGVAPARVGSLLADTGAWFPAATAGATEDADEGRAAVEILVNQQDVGRWPLLLPHRVTRRDRRRALSGGRPIREHPAPRRLPVRLYGARLAGVAPSGPSLSDDDRGEGLALPAVVDPRLRALAHGLAPERRPARAPRGHRRAPAGRLPLHAPPRGLPHRRPPRRVPVREEGRLLRVLRERGRRPPSPAGSAGPLRQGPERGTADRPGRWAPRGAGQRRPRLGGGVDPRRGLGGGRPDPARFVRRGARTRGLLPAVPPARARRALRRLGSLDGAGPGLAPAAGRVASSHAWWPARCASPSSGSWPSASPSGLGSFGPGALAALGVARRHSTRAPPCPPSFGLSCGRSSAAGGPSVALGPRAVASSSTRVRSPLKAHRAGPCRPGWRRRATSSRPTTGRGSAASRRTRRRRPGSATGCARPEPRAASLQQRGLRHVHAAGEPDVARAGADEQLVAALGDAPGLRLGVVVREGAGAEGEGDGLRLARLQQAPSRRPSAPSRAA